MGLLWRGTRTWMFVHRAAERIPVEIQGDFLRCAREAASRWIRVGRPVVREVRRGTRGGARHGSPPLPSRGGAGGPF